MNAIVNMTALGLHYIDDKERVEGCLKKIEISSQHLLSLVNDVLDMSRMRAFRGGHESGGSPSAGASEADFRHHGAAGQGRRTRVSRCRRRTLSIPFFMGTRCILSVS